ncbi:MAG: hypothetical protein ACYC8V_03080, partial [Caulobacteraceae bacterium]
MMPLPGRARGGLAAGLSALVLAGAAAATPRPTIQVGHAWTRPTAAGMNAAGYLVIVNRGQR